METAPSKITSEPSSTPRPRSLKHVGFVLVLGLMAALLALALPNSMRARCTHCTNACIENLRWIDSAKQQWALEDKKKDSAMPTPDDIRVYMKNS